MMTRLNDVHPHRAARGQIDVFPEIDTQVEPIQIGSEMHGVDEALGTIHGAHRAAGLVDARADPFIIGCDLAVDDRRDQVGWLARLVNDLGPADGCLEYIRHGHATDVVHVLQVCPE